MEKSFKDHLGIIKDVTLSKKQDNCLTGVLEWIDKGCVGQMFTIAGYAGTGKSLLIKLVIQIFTSENTIRKKLNVVTYKLNQILPRSNESFIEDNALLDIINENDKVIVPVIVSLTGKSVCNLKKLGLTNVSTVHSLLYHTEVDPDTGKYTFILRNRMEIIAKYNFIIVEEAFMLNNTIMKEILGIGLPVLGVGDPEQLEPIGGASSLKEDFFLDEIHRQALHNPIIRLSKEIRETGKLPFKMKNEFVLIDQKSNIDFSTFTRSDQIIAMTRKNVSALNDEYRDYIGNDTLLPMEKDKLIVTTNNYNQNLFNGTGLIVSDNDIQVDFPNNIFQVNVFDEMYTPKEVKENPSLVTRVSGYISDFYEYSDEELAKHKLKLKPKQFLGRDDQLTFVFGFARTCHSVQGSQYRRVLVDTTSLWGDRTTRKRLLYTAVTRSSEKLIIAR